VEAAIEVAQERSGRAYDPAVVACFSGHATDLLDLPEPESVWDAVLEAEPGARPCLAGDRLDIALRAMADFVDLKSRYLRSHSPNVATLAAAAAQQCHCSGAEAETVRRAGLLHDLGRAGVTVAIWDKPGTLTQDEWEQVRLHPYYTDRVLKRSPLLASLGAVASLHHERLDGSGYHRSLPAAMLSTPARLLAAADTYHAMTEPRPHRPAREPEAAADALRLEAKAGKLDGGAVDAVLAAAGHRVSAARRTFPAGLSEREVEVLGLIARGYSNKQMAETLVISKDTVGHHIRHIYDKLDVSTRAAATLFAMQHDLVPGTQAG
jgi:HD-GYP domain-containing protein (c-di-GMP phosphodiesterase class II)